MGRQGGGRGGTRSGYLHASEWSPSNSTTQSLDGDSQAALFIISAAAFGRRLAWKDEVVPPPGHKMTFKVRSCILTQPFFSSTMMDREQDALHIVASDYLYKLILPNWVMGLTKHSRAVQLGFNELEVRGHTFQTAFVSQSIPWIQEIYGRNNQ